MMKAAVLAGVQSGCGKTTIMMALLQYLMSRSASESGPGGGSEHGSKIDAVTSFKTGPDFLDPLWHQAVTGRLSYNLDTRMMGEESCRQQLMLQADAEFALIEGVMGMFDGHGGVGGPGSAADLARVLYLPVWLVVDARGMSGSIVALVSGFVVQAQKMGIKIGAIVANRLGSERHAKILTDLLAEHDLPPLIAWMDKHAPVMPERHLGLVRPNDIDGDINRVPDFSAHFHVNEALLETCWSLPVDDLLSVDAAQSDETRNDETRLLEGRRIAVARDEACCFIYQANLDWLVAQGAQIQFFSPLAGDAIGQNIDAVWLPGGYPELYGQALSQSASWVSLAAFIAEGKPVLAECGGMMMLGETLLDIDQQSWPMAGVLPFSSRMQGRLASLGYRSSRDGVQGHEFHHSVRENSNDLPVAFDVARGDKGVRQLNLRASYIHWYFPSAPKVVAQWLGAQSVSMASDLEGQLIVDDKAIASI